MTKSIWSTRAGYEQLELGDNTKALIATGSDGLRQALKTIRDIDDSEIQKTVEQLRLALADRMRILIIVHNNQEEGFHRVPYLDEPKDRYAMKRKTFIWGLVTEEGTFKGDAYAIDAIPALPIVPTFTRDDSHVEYQALVADMMEGSKVKDHKRVKR